MLTLRLTLVKFNGTLVKFNGEGEKQTNEKKLPYIHTQYRLSSTVGIRTSCIFRELNRNQPN